MSRKRSKNLKFVLYILSLIVVLAVVVFIQQKVTYGNGNKSFIFGQKLNYSQNQTMPFNGFVFSVQKTVSVPFTPYALPICGTSSITLQDCLSTTFSNQAYNDAEKGKLQYQINLTAKNTQNKVANISNYKFSFDSNSVEILGKNIDTSGTTPNGSKTFSLHIRVPQATKNVNLLIQNSNTTKYYSVSL